VGQSDPPAAEVAVPEGLSVDDWSGIRAAYEAGRHAAYEVEGGYRAHNPGQRWSTRFDGRGFTTVPDVGGWSWGLELQSFGFAGGEREVNVPARMDADGGRVTYDWDATLQEWYVNDRRGLEHGYVVRRRPARNGEGDAGPLTLTLEVRGGLRSLVNADGRGVRLVDDEGAALLTYSGLVVFDADGEELRASMASVGERLRFTIEERGARYPLTIDPIAQQAYLKASNSDAFDYFGYSVAVSGDTVVVGALLEDSNATGVNGDQSDNSAPEAGAAYVFVRNGPIWSQEAYLKASNTNRWDHFGYSVAVSGDTVVVGAEYERSGATGVNGDQSDNTAYYAGAAYVFTRSSGIWSQEAYLKGSNTETWDLFGRSVAVSDDTVVVGAPGEASGATGVDGNENDNSLTQAGAAYVFRRSGASWSQEAYLKASTTDKGDFFGNSISVSDDTVAVGAGGEASSATGVNGDQSDNSAYQAGAVYVFRRSSGTWSQEAYLKASNTDPGDLFGWSVSVSGDTAVVGAFRESSSATGVNGDQSDNSATWSGAAYVFAKSGGSWHQDAYLKASNTDADDWFGCAVALSDDVVVVGASGEDSDSTGVDGDQSDNSALQAGAAYVFRRDTTGWIPEAYLKASNAASDARFGFPVSVSGDTVVIGAQYEDSNATGVNGDQTDDSAEQAGAAYVFDLDAPSIGTNYCGSAVINSSGLPGIITAYGSSAVAARYITLVASQLPTDEFGYFLNSQTQGFVANPGGSQGNLCLGGATGRHLSTLGSSGAAGELRAEIDLAQLPTPLGPYAVQPGETWCFQCWFHDHNPHATSNFTDAVSIVFN